MSHQYSQLFKIAIVVSFIMGIPGVMPIYFQENSTLNDLLRGFAINSLSMFFLWLVNLALLKAFEKTRHKYFRFVASVLIALLASFLLSLFMEQRHHMPPPELKNMPPHPMPHMRPRHFFPYFLNQLTNLVILFIIELFISRNQQKIILDENSELKIKNLEAKQLQLKQQIQPHFLFNSLNTLKSMISSHHADAEEYLVKLSSFLRHNIDSGSQDMHALKDELDICRDYLDIQKIRFKNALKYSIDISDESALLLKVPVFSIQMLIENAIKHNSLTVESPLHIDIEIGLHKISVYNNMQKKASDESTKVGLQNLSERYKLLLDKDIEVIQNTSFFKVVLPLA